MRWERPGIQGATVAFEFDQAGHLARIHGVAPVEGVGAWNETLGLGRALSVGSGGSFELAGDRPEAAIVSAALAPDAPTIQTVWSRAPRA